jgi:UDP-N-acetylglucosamine 2-epimerase
MQVVTLVGNRPQFVKAAAVSGRLRRRHDEMLVHSGQHYDDELSAVFFRELALPAPDRQLGVGSGTVDEQVAGIMHAFEPVLRNGRPDVVLVYGDTNTTLAGALSCARLDVPLAHVESGMRSWDETMPEERNRVITDHLSALRLCSTPTAVENLAGEHVRDGVELVGDVMADVTLMMAPVAERESDAPSRYGVKEGDYLLVTAHRAGNVDDPAALGKLVDVLVALERPALFPVHPRTHARLQAAGLLERLEQAVDLQLLPPLGYLDFLKLLRHSQAVLTDSGGVQKEAYLLEVPCLTLRETTEWTETVTLGWNRLVGLDRDRAREALAQLERPTEHPDLYGGGNAGEAVVQALERWSTAR